ncbi:hypothetical protein ABC970_22260 [Bacillus licheniformis]|uniref:hypothetical protein n=1 Tax=Bacillus TaxID=1386 RepID=UPI000ADF2B6C|nr:MULTISPECIES: hypothetical protein [Bacillus]ASK26231.1 hypothetical protein BSSX_p0040 [Bacillus subtilis]MCQ5304563.1 hypothetical protein [Bacillus licheniformis]MDM5287389.1 hypothetical protein [Bacillus licheniformis]MEC0776933.1 hypothetical protein [Bacillus licheniformis]MED1661749.1 hypothetical protein [Bacillus licheniformis]
MAYRVFDKRTDETIFEAFESKECVWFIECNYDENDDDYEHIFIEKIKQRPAGKENEG